ncbi:MAG: Ig-like domain-containing protein [Candidatus Sumerlaeia bacterium]
MLRENEKFESQSQESAPKPACRRDQRTCVKPVTLEPGRYYRFGINSSEYHNFKSVEGIPVEPISVYFTTRGAAPELEAKMRKPRVVSMDPPNGATGVDPNTAELRVTFDVPMGAGFSWCGGGSDYPEVPEGVGARWSEDRKTCTLPVKLKPGWQYSLSLNNVSFNNFMSEAGIPLEPVAYGFKTK